MFQLPLSKAFSDQYAAGHGQPGDGAAEDSIRRVAEHLNAADSEASVCIICLELLKRKDAVWSCADGCADTVHLSCIQVRRLDIVPNDVTSVSGFMEILLL